MRTWHLSNFYFFYFTTIGVVVPYWGLFLQSRGFNAREIGQLMAIFLLTKLIAPNIWASIADNMTAKKGSSLSLLKQASLITFVLYCLMFVVESFWATALVMFSFCIFWNASLPQLEATTLNRDSYPERSADEAGNRRKTTIARTNARACRTAPAKNGAPGT